METKNKQITLLQGKDLLIELPEGVSNPRIWPESPDRLYVDDPLGYDGVDQIDLPPGNWRIIGMLSEVTEEQAGMLVEKVMNGQHHQNYNYKSVIERWVKTALESLESAILAAGWYFENPYGMERPPNLPIDAIPYDQQPGYRAFRNTKPHLPPNNIELSYEFYCLAWQKAQSRVLDRSRCLLLGREGGMMEAAK